MPLLRLSLRYPKGCNGIGCFRGCLCPATVGLVSPDLRSFLRDLPVYEPSAVPVGAAKLDSNELAYGPLPQVVAEMTAAMRATHRYPDNGMSALTRSLAAHMSVDSNLVQVGSGSAALCQALVTITCDRGDEVVFGWPSFEAYPLMALVAQAVPVRVPLTDKASYDLKALSGAITERTGLVFVCNPNNPTGTVVGDRELRDFLREVPGRVTVVIDEAYVEFRSGDVPCDGALALRAEFDNVVVLRTFSKAYGLAGLRVGYAVGSRDVVDALKRVHPPFSVNSVAQRAALACLAASDELLARIRPVAEERSRVIRRLRGLDTMVPESEANFVWLPLGDRAAKFADDALAAGLVLRAFPGHGVRVTITTRVECDAFLTFAERWLRS